MIYQSYEDYMRSVLGNSYANEYTNQSYNYPYVREGQNVSTYAMPTNVPNLTDSRQMNMQSQPNMANQANMSNQMNMQSQTNFQSSMRRNSEPNMEESEEILKIKKMYPDIYCLLMPMVNKIVEENKDREVTESLVESMTMEIYNNIEDDMVVGRNLQAQQNARVSSSSNTTTTTSNSRANNSQSSNSSTSRTTTVARTNTTSTQSGVSRSSDALMQSQINSRNQTSQSNMANSTSNRTAQNSRRIGNPTLKDLIKILIIRRLLERKRNTRTSSAVDNNFSVPVNQNIEMNNNYVPVMNQNPAIQSMQNSPTSNMNRQVNANINQMNYPFSNYFATPYPEDEYVN